MCVIIFKPAGAELPPFSVLSDCWTSNPDGAGLAVSGAKDVYVRKGFMKLKDLQEFYETKELRKRVAQAMIFHFRIGTHGLKDAGNTHPFPVSPNPATLRKLESRYLTAVAHNGVFNLKVTLPDVSDTGQFLANCFLDRKTPEEYWKANPTLRGWSRLVVLRSDNRYTLLGDWHCEADDGCFYSNLSWKRSKYASRWAGRTGQSTIGFTGCGCGYGGDFADQGHGGYEGYYDGDDYYYAPKVTSARAPTSAPSVALTPTQLQEEEDYFKLPRYDKQGVRINPVETSKEETPKPEVHETEEVDKNWLGGDKNLPLLKASEVIGPAATLKAAAEHLTRITVKKHVNDIKFLVKT